MTPSAPPLDETPFATFTALDIRVGTIVEASVFPEARKAAYKLTIDFGPGVGRKTNSAQITDHYTPDALAGRQVMGVVNLPPRQIGPIRSEVLVLGFADANGAIVLAQQDRAVPNGARMS